MNIVRWPYRRIRYLQENIFALKEAAGMQDNEQHSRASVKIAELQNEIHEIFQKGLPYNKTPPKTKLTGVAKRGRPKVKRNEIETFDGPILEEYYQWDEAEDAEVSMITESYAPLGFHLKLDVEEIESIVHTMV
jgi:hypothetical protein